MALRFTNLGSGSSGNATLIEARHADGGVTRVLVDCGLTLRELSARLATRGTSADALDAVFVTHEHSDHVGCVLALQRRHRIAVWASAGTWRHATRNEGVAGSTGRHIARSGDTIVIGALELRPFAVPHDAAEPLQLTCSDGAHRLGILTDLGEPNEAVVAALQGCDALLLECNHDPQMLADGGYPVWLQRRIGGARGHLANAQSAEILSLCRHDGLRLVVAAHLSQHNNRPELALAALHRAAGPAGCALSVADARDGSPWLTLG